MSKPVGSSYGPLNLGSIAVVSCRPDNEETVTVDSEELLSQAHSKVATPPPSPPSSPLVIRLQEQAPPQQARELTVEERTMFIKFLTYIVNPLTKKTPLKSVKHVDTVIKLARNLNLKSMKGETIDVEAVATAVGEIILKNKIQLVIGKTPTGVLILKGSELINIIRPSLQRDLENIFNQAVHEEPRGRGFATGVPSDQFISKCFLIVSTSVLNGALEVCSAPDRLVNLLTQTGVTSVKYTGFWIIDEMVVAGKWIGNNLSLTDVFPMSLIGRLDQGIRMAQENPVKTTEGVPEDPLPATYPIPSEGGQRAARAVISDCYLPISHKPHPITEVVGGSFSVSGGSSTPTSYSAQVNVTIAGPKNLPPPPYPVGHIGPGSNTGGPYAGGSEPNPDNIFSGPIRAKYQEFSTLRKEYNQASETLAIREQEVNPNDPPDVKISKYTLLKRGREYVANKAKQLGEVGFELHELTRKTVRKNYSKKAGDEASDINKEVKGFLYNDLQVPQNEKLKKEDLASSKKLSNYNNVTDLDKKIEIAKIDKEVSETVQKINEKQKSVHGLETADGTVDAQTIETAVKELDDLGQKLFGLLQRKETLSPGSVPQEVFSTIKSKGERNRMLISQRSARYGKIDSDSKELGAEMSSLLPKFIENKNPEELAQHLVDLRGKKERNDRDIDELVRQTPNNTEKNRSF